MNDAYLKLQKTLGALLCAVGAAMVAATIVAGGGPATLGFLAGVAIAALGAARVWLAVRAGSGGRNDPGAPDEAGRGGSGPSSGAGGRP